MRIVCVCHQAGAKRCSYSGEDFAFLEPKTYNSKCPCPVSPYGVAKALCMSNNPATEGKPLQHPCWAQIGSMHVGHTLQQGICSVHLSSVLFRADFRATSVMCEHSHP